MKSRGSTRSWPLATWVPPAFSRPGTPTDNAFIEAFNGRFQAECLNTHWFLTLADAAEKLKAWRRYYNEDRPDGAIGNKPPISLMNPDGNQPAVVTKPGKLYLPAVQRWVSEQGDSNPQPAD